MQNSYLTILSLTNFAGMYEFEKTGQVLPILVGTLMADRGGSGQEVPILGAARHQATGKVIPLAGTMEDPEGAGLCFDESQKLQIPPLSVLSFLVIKLS